MVLELGSLLRVVAAGEDESGGVVLGGRLAWWEGAGR